MHDGDAEEGLEAGGQTRPADNPSAALAGEPCARPFRLNARDALVDRSAAGLSRLPQPFRGLGAHPAGAAALTEHLGLIPFLGRHDLAPLTRPAAWARPDVDGIPPGDAVGPRVAMGGCGTRRPGPAGAVRAAMDQETLALPAMGPPDRPLGQGEGTTAGAVWPPPSPTGLGQAEPAGGALAAGGAAREITPAAPGDQDVAPGLADGARRRVRQATAARGRRWRQHRGNARPRQVPSPREGPSPGALPKPYRALEHGPFMRGICSWIIIIQFLPYQSCSLIQKRHRWHLY